MVQFFGIPKVERKTLFLIGKTGFIITLMILGFLFITNNMEKQDDLKSYFNFWQHVWPSREYDSMSRSAALNEFHKHSMFDT